MKTISQIAAQAKSRRTTRLSPVAPISAHIVRPTYAPPAIGGGAEPAFIPRPATQAAPATQAMPAMQAMPATQAASEAQWQAPQGAQMPHAPNAIYRELMRKHDRLTQRHLKTQ